MVSKTGLHPSTSVISKGYERCRSEGAVNEPRFGSSAYVFQNAQEGTNSFAVALGMREQEDGESISDIYIRLGHPNAHFVEERIGLWDGAGECAIFSSGMAAISTVCFTYLHPGDILLHSEPLYGGSDHFMKDILPLCGIFTYGFDHDCLATQLETLFRAHGHAVKMVFIETPSNPLLTHFDIGVCARIAHQYGANLVVDGTFMPIHQTALAHGADIVIHSATKYFGGHSDLLAGVVMGSHDIVAPVKALRTTLGNIADVSTCELLQCHMKSLEIRFAKQVENARVMAEFLLHHPKVERVYYPEFLDHKDPQRLVFEKQCSSPGAMVSFDLARGNELVFFSAVPGVSREGMYPRTFRFLNALEIACSAVSLGGVESLVCSPSTTTHLGMKPEDRAKIGITDKLIRFSLGIENADDLVRDAKQALDAV